MSRPAAESDVDARPIRDRLPWMRTLVGCALFVAIAAALTRWHGGTAPEPHIVHEHTPASSASATTPGGLQASLCPPGTLPDLGVCVPVPQRAAEHRRATTLPVRVPLLPDRPGEFTAYRWPVPVDADTVITPWEREFPGDGAGGFSLATPPGAEVHAAVLDGETSPPSAWEITSDGIVTLHSVRRADREPRLVLVSIQGMVDVAPLDRGAAIEPAARLGRVDSASRLRLTVRRLRTGVSPDGGAERVDDDARSVELDPRNVFALAAPSP